MAVPAIGGISGAGGLSHLAELYRQQITGSAAAARPASTAAAATAGTGAVQATGTPGVGGVSGVSGVSGGGSFTSALGDGLRAVESLDRTASAKAVAAATGDLTDVHDYVIAATQAQVATELTTTVRNKALDAFNEIMRMPL
ncbi:MAG: flagellar hook-basal body complex protein FliE [Actinomycetales bacterium]|nr:flagellar hook-basal body complex protein FliE [Actinomycetales bacterium]